jgi:uncharacterized membrane protein (DUF441 family)
MSLNSLASGTVAREVAAKKGRQPALQEATEDVRTGTEDVQNALSALVEYVPAETITLYLAVASALPVLQRSIDALTAPIVYWGFVVLTPILFILIYAGKRRAAQLGHRFPQWKQWPWWPMCAATIAFMVWGLAGPNRPYFTGEGGDVVVGLFAIIASTVLGVIARFVGVPASSS